MQINKFKKVGKNKYKVFFDDTELTLYEDIILKYELLIKHAIDLETLDKIIDENKFYDAYNLSLCYIETKMRSKKEIIDYLTKKEFDNSYIEYAIKKLEDSNLLNSVSYIEAFINDKVNLSNDGPFKIRRLLLEDDFLLEDIDNYLNKIDNKIWMDRIEKIVDKRVKLNNKSYYMLISKLKNDLYNLGYDMEMINEILSNIKYDNSNVNKELNKCIKKYKGDKNKIINYLLRKGYSYDEINNEFNNIQ